MYKMIDTRITKFRICDSCYLESGVRIPCITGQVGQVDVVSQNGWRYKTDFWDKVLNDPVVQETIKSHDMLGTTEHPTDDDKFLRTPYEEASHIVLKAWVQDHNPFAIFGLLNNEKGNIIKSLVDVGHCPGVSTRGMGNFETDSISKFVSPNDYVLIVFDIVRSPNFPTLKMDPVTDSLIKHPTFKELCDAHNIQDSVYQGYNKESLIKDMSMMVDELKKKINFLSNLS